MDSIPQISEKSTTDKSNVPRFTREKLVAGMKNGEFKKITVMTGAGISVAAGIPDFRSPDTGLYATLKDYNLPFPEAIFNIEYFVEKPEPFYKLAKEFLDMRKYKATYVHHFNKMLKDKGCLSHYLTQNIDNLETLAGFELKDIIQAHGGNHGAKCAKCGQLQDQAQLVDKISRGEVMRCKDPACGGPVKPDIVFFGESLPANFVNAAMNVQKDTDLLIVIGTSLKVAPFNQMVNVVGETVPKVLINLEDTATSGYDFDDAEKYPERIFLKGKSQDTIQALAQDLEWIEELHKRKKEADEKHDAENAGLLTNQFSSLGVENNQNGEAEGSQVDTSQKVGKKPVSFENEPECGPLMGFFAVEPIKECPHCIPDVFITPVEEFKDISIQTPCYECGHCQENWICLKTKVIGCSRYVKNHMLQYYEKEKNPLVLSFADFSYWCYECDSYVVSKHLNHVEYFYPQKFGAERASHLQEFAGIMASKAKKDDKTDKEH